MLSLLYVLGVLLLLALALVGLGVLTAGRRLDDAGGTGPAGGVRSHRVAEIVDASVRRTRVAVAELISTDVHRDDLRPSRAEFSRRGHTYTVLGAGLVGLAAALLLGLLLVL